MVEVNNGIIVDANQATCDTQPVLSIQGRPVRRLVPDLTKMLSEDIPLKRSKYREIVAFIEEVIAQGKYRAGDRLPSESELVKQFGASRPTVTRAMRELQNSGAIQRRAGSGSYVSARSDKAEIAHRLFGVLVPRFGDTEIFESICGQIAREADAADHGLFWTDVSASGDGLDIADRICEAYIRQRVSGVFFAPEECSAQKDEFNRRVVSLFDAAGIPIVLLDRDFTPFPERSRYDLVGIDNYAVGYLLGQHLVEQGCKRVNFLALPYSASTVQIRISGAYAALMAGGRRPADDWVKIADTFDEEAMRSLIKTNPDAIICANDKTAAELMSFLAQQGVNVPKNIKVVGVDDVRYAKLLRPALTTIHQPCHAIGTAAMQAMVERLANPKASARSILLSANLVVRPSSL